MNLIDNRMSESLKARVKANAYKAYTLLIENHKITKKFAKKVRQVLIINRATNFPHCLKAALLKMFICTKDLAAEREIAHYEEPEGIREDFHGIAKQIQDLKKKVNGI